MEQESIGTCADCGNILVKPVGTSASGYASLVIARCMVRVCYQCAYVRELADMRGSERFFCYLSSDSKTVTTWTGHVLGRAVQCGSEIRYTPTGGRHEVYYVRVIDLDGNAWHGRGPGPSCYVRLTRNKVKISTP